MSELIHFSQAGVVPAEANREKIGIRGRRVAEMAGLGIQVSPGFILDSDMCRQIEKVDLAATLRAGIARIEQATGRTFGDASNPLFLKILCTSNIRLEDHYPSVHNIGLNESTAAHLAEQGGANFAASERAYLVRNYAAKLLKLDAEPFKQAGGDLSALESLIPAEKRLSTDPLQQAVQVVRLMASNYSDPDDPEDELAVLVQAMVYGNFGEDSFAGWAYTRDHISGEEKIRGRFARSTFDVNGDGQDISELDDATRGALEATARKLEDHFKELRKFKFTRERGKLWIIEQTSVDHKSTQATVKTLLSLLKRGIVNEREVTLAIPPGQLNELLHPVIDEHSIVGMPHAAGGLAGSPGAASGKVFFSATRLMDAHREATLRGEDANFILVVHASYAEDVKGIEVSQGVISVEGGYASHAPVVARSLGKVALVIPRIELKHDDPAHPHFILDGHRVNEGDVLSMDVPFYRDPVVYFGKVALIKPDAEKNGLLDFIKVVDGCVDHATFTVRANADLGRDAIVARAFGAKGIGLCRTEHMFFAEERIHRFRRMILAGNETERREILGDLEAMQVSDFYDLFATMHPYPVTIRLLDAPLHEFLPRSAEMLESYLGFLAQHGFAAERQAIETRIAIMDEVNPMLGHRGCRVAISYPEIYEMQIRAIFRAAVRMNNEGKPCKPEIMIPIVMNEAEMKFIRFGKKIEGKSIPGVHDIALKIARDNNLAELPYSVGCMVELPAAALAAGLLARHAEFFSFGTNDLTQTTFGLSRDDVSSFFPVYTEYDLLSNNPFQVLGDQVKELIGIATERGRLTRPDLKLGLCGEHGADPVNIAFCKQRGLNYTSCSPFSVPIALLAVAQYNLKEAAGA